MLMVSLRSGLVRDRQKSDRVGGGTNAFVLPTFVLLLAAARTLPAALAAAKAAAHPELSGLSASTDSVGPGSGAVGFVPPSSSSTGGASSFSDTRRRPPSSSALSGTSSRNSTTWLRRRPPRRSSSTSGRRHAVCVVSSELRCSKSSFTGDGTSASWLLTDVIFTCSTNRWAGMQLVLTFPLAPVRQFSFQFPVISRLIPPFLPHSQYLFLFLPSYSRAQWIRCISDADCVFLHEFRKSYAVYKNYRFLGWFYIYIFIHQIK